MQAFAEEAADEHAGPSGPREVASVGGRLMDAINLLSATTARSYHRWQARYDREWHTLLESYEQILSHELGNRLGAAETALELLRPQLPDGQDRGAHLCKLVQESIESGSQTIDDVASLTRPYLMGKEAGLSLWLVVKESVRLADTEAQRQGISVSVVDQVPEVKVPGAPVRVALANLLSNAIKYHRDGGAERWVRVATHLDKESDTVEITVEDNGPGIPESACESVFDYRFRGDVRQEGSGLSLAITRELLQEVGGVILLRQGTEGGALFTLTVPVGG